MKRAIAIGFLAILMLNIAGVYVMFFRQLQQVHDMMREELRKRPASDLQVLCMSTTDFQRALRSADEIEFENKMYDVARVVVTPGSVEVYCLQDPLEDDLLALLDKILEVAGRDKSPVPGSILILLLPNDSVLFAWCPRAERMPANVTSMITRDFPEPIINILIPPPRA